MELLVDRSGPLSLHVQITGQLRALIAAGRLAAGERLPTINEAARSWGVNANTVAAAYRSLEEEGYLIKRRRAGTRVAPQPPHALELSAAARLATEVLSSARSSGIDPADLVAAVASEAAAAATLSAVRVAVLAANPLSASRLARRVESALAGGVECVPVTAGEYRSLDYHLTVVAPELAATIQPGARAGTVHSYPSYLRYGPDFPAAAD